MEEKCNKSIKLKDENGVTLIALVVTIVVLLILAGVSLAMLSGDNGIINQAQNASEQYKIAQNKEQLELAKQAEIAKGEGNIDVDDYFDRLENEGIVNDKDTDIVDNGDGSYDITTDDGYIFEVTPIPDEENTEDIEIDYVGQGEIVGPRINKITVTEKTETSISIEVVTRNAEGGNYTYSYKKATESNYTQAQTTTNNTYTFTKLEENTEYNIKVKVETAEGSIEKTITVKTKAEEIEEPDPPEEEVPVGTIAFETPTWSGGKASIQVSTTSGYGMEYQLNSTTGSWTSISNNGTIQNLTHNTTVNVRLVNGSKRGEVQSTTIQDTNKPTVTVSKQGNATTNTITVTVQATDNESGMITSPTYTYFIKKTSEGSYTQKASNANNSYTFTELDQGTSYDIKVEVQGDNAGNKGEGTLTNITTVKVTGGTEEGAITFGNPTWSAGQASITISTNTSYKIEYQLNGTTGSWIEIANNGTISNIPNNTTVYARLTDGNNHGDYTSTTIKDTINPTVTIESLTAEDTTIQITAKGTDNESGINEYVFYIKESTQEDSSYVEKARNTTGTATIEGLEIGKTYTVKVEVTDKANNTGSATKDIEIKEPPITNQDILNTPSEYFGKIVSNYDCPNNAGVNAWKIFYADENNIYLIADDYVHYQYLPNGKGGGQVKQTPSYHEFTTPYSIDLSEITESGEYIGSLDIIDEKIRALCNEYFSKGYSSTNSNMKRVAYMLDTSVWNVFAGRQAEYAIGAPTLDLLFKSYNKKYGTDYQAYVENSSGYALNKNGSYRITNMLDEKDSLYVINSKNKAYGMMIANPSISNSGISYSVRFDGTIDGNGIVDSGDEDSDGMRPIVCLKSGIELEKQEDGTYHIIDTLRSGDISFGEPLWKEDQASVTVNTNTNFQIEYQIGEIEEGKWRQIENNGTILGLKDGDTIYARLTDGTNYGDYASINITIGITSAEIAKNPTEYYGKTITNYTCPNNAGVNKWQIFHSDGNNIYLIADNYIHADYCPPSANNEIIDYDSGYILSMIYVIEDYNGSANITDEKIKELNNDYFNVKKYTSTNNNMKAVAYMLDTDIWSVFKGEQAEYAIGGPTIELLFESYNKRYNLGYESEASQTGYIIKKRSSDYWSDNIENMLNTADGLYVISSTSRAYSYWVASPSANSPHDVMNVYYDGEVGYNDYSSASIGFRPLVCLKSNVRIEKEENGNGYIIK